MINDELNFLATEDFPSTQKPTESVEGVTVRLAGDSSKVSDGDDSGWYRLADAPPGGIAAPVKKLIDSLRNSEEIGRNG